MKRISNWLKKYFIPHEHNDWKPHFLRHESAFFFFLLISVVELGFLAQVFIIFDKTNFLAAVLPGVLTSLTNKERADDNEPPLTTNDLLTKAAELKANDMATRGYFAHTSPDGKTPWYWLDQVKYNYASAGENLAVNFFESDEVARAWMNSPTHRANILKGEYVEIGIGVASGVYQGRDSVFVAQFFGTPVKALAVAQPVVPPPAQIVKVTPILKPSTPIPKPATPAPKVVVTKILGDETTTSQTQIKENDTMLIRLKTFIQKILTSPRQYVTYIFGGILLLVTLALACILFIRAEMAHPFSVARGVFLALFIGLLLFVNIKVLHLDTKVPTEGLSATVIAY